MLTTCFLAVAFLSAQPEPIQPEPDWFYVQFADVAGMNPICKEKGSVEIKGTIQVPAGAEPEEVFLQLVRGMDPDSRRTRLLLPAKIVKKEAKVWHWQVKGKLPSGEHWIRLQYTYNLTEPSGKVTKLTTYGMEWRMLFVR